MKHKVTLYLLSLLTLTTGCINAKNIFSNAWNKTKQTAQSTYDKAQEGWDALDPETKNAVKIGLATTGAVAGAAALGGAAYYGYDQYNSNIQTRPAFTQDQGTFDELVSFLSTDPNYANKPSNQKSFLNRFKDKGLTEDEMRNILDIVAVETAPPTLPRDY